MIVMKVNLEKIPDNCRDCMMCAKPINKYSNSEKVNKKYYHKRHERCPLMKVEMVGIVK